MRNVLVDHTAICEAASRWTRLMSLTILLTASLVAQSDRGTITGTVTDPSSAAVAGAKVEAKNVDNGVVYRSTTTTAGGFTIPSLPSGKYDLAVTATGFKTANESGVEVLLDQTVKVDVGLQIGQTSESVSVVATAELLKTDNAEISMNVNGEKVNELPINFGGGGSVTGGIRNWLSFTYLAPGVAGTSANSEVNGLPGSNFKVYLEGQDSTSNNDAAWTSTQLAASRAAPISFMALRTKSGSTKFSTPGCPSII